MQFYDEVSVHLESGRGGDGVVSARRESGVPFGGPAGWNGWNGGDISFIASKDENTLLPYRYRKIFRANKWEPGRSKDQYWANADSMELVVPVGTLIKDKETGAILHSFSKDGEKWTALRWWEGGKWNIFFKDPVNQFPNFALYGEPGQTQDIVLELQLLADVALIGNPSVGKSSLINCVSAAKAKVAEYPFTTLIPNLGSVTVQGYNFNMIDIPGLIEWASEGKGLGNAFLRHILKSKIFCLVADADRYDSGIVETVELLEEILDYIQEKFTAGDKATFEIKIEKNTICLHTFVGKELILEKKLIFAINKYDLVNDEEIIKEYKDKFLRVINKFLEKRELKILKKDVFEKNTFVLSAATKFGIDAWLNNILHLLKITKTHEMEYSPHVIDNKEKAPMFKNITKKEKQFLLDNEYIQEATSKYLEVWEMYDREFCKMAFMLPWGNDEAELRFWKRAQDHGYMKLFEEANIRKGDAIKIKSFYKWMEDRYIMF